MGTLLPHHFPLHRPQFNMPYVAKRLNNNYRRSVKKYARASNKKMSQAIAGYALRNLPIDPPTFVRQPWNNLVLEHVFVTADASNLGQEYIILPTDIIGFICEQLDINVIPGTVKARIAFKIKTVKLFAGWDDLSGAGSTGRPAVFLDIASRTPQVEDTVASGATFKGVNYPSLTKLRDTGSFNKSASVGYVYPRAQQEIPYLNSPGIPIISVAANRLQFTLRMNICWSFNGPADVS